MSRDCLGGGRRHQHRPVLTDSFEEDLHWGWYSKYLHKSLRSEMLLLHLPESHNNCGDGGTGGSGEQTGETSFGRGGWAEHRASSDFSLSALTLYREWRAWLDHFVRLIISATVISVFLLFLLIIASSSSVTEPWIRICLKNFYYFPSLCCLYQGLSALWSQYDLLLLLLRLLGLLLQPNSLLVRHLITPQPVLVEPSKAEDEGLVDWDCDAVDDGLLLTCWLR